MNSTKQLYITQKDTAVMTTPQFNIMRYLNDSLTLENIVRVKKENYAIKYILKRLRHNDSVPDIFDPALNKWREKPVQAENDEATKHGFGRYCIIMLLILRIYQVTKSLYSTSTRSFAL
jgi:hypothetical protein